MATAGCGDESLRYGSNAVKMKAVFTGLLVVGLIVTTRTLSSLIRSMDAIRPLKTAASRDRTVTCGIGACENGGVKTMSYTPRLTRSRSAPPVAASGPHRTGRPDQSAEGQSSEIKNEWGEHHTTPVVAVTVAGRVVIAVGRADVPAIEAERPAAQHTAFRRRSV